MTDEKYEYMSRKELAVAANITPRTLRNYLNEIWDILAGLGCKKYKKLTPAGVKYICQRYEVHL